MEGANFHWNSLNNMNDIFNKNHDIPIIINNLQNPEWIITAQNTKTISTLAT